MAGVEVEETVDMGSSVRSGRLVLSGRWGGDYDATALACLAGLMLVLAGFGSLKVRGLDLLIVVPLFVLAISALWLASRLFRAASRSYDLVQIAGGTDADATRAAFTHVVDQPGWEKNRNNAEFARYFFDRYVITAIFRPDHVLLNCRRAVVNRTRWPISLKERDELVRMISQGMAAATRPSNPALNPTGLRPAG